MIECASFYGEKRLLPKDRFTLRPSAYAVIAQMGKILLVTNLRSGRYYLPGGGVECGERIVDGLKREVEEEAGIEIERERLVHFEEDFLYYDPLDEAYHALLFYFVCKPKTLELSGGHCEDDGEGNPQWITIRGLQAHDFHNHGELILRLVRSAVGSNNE